MPLTLQFSISSSLLPPPTVTGGFIKAWFMDNVLRREYDDLQLLRGLRYRRNEIKNFDTLASHGFNSPNEIDCLTLTVSLRPDRPVVSFFVQPFEQPFQRVNGFHVRAELTPPAPFSPYLTGADIKSWILASFHGRSVDDFSLFNCSQVIPIATDQSLQDLNIDPLLSSPFILKHSLTRLPLAPITQIHPQYDPNEFGIQRVSIGSSTGPGLDPSFTGPWAAPVFSDPGQSSSRIHGIQNMGYPQFPVRPPGTGPSRSAGPSQSRAVENVKAGCRRAMQEYVMRLLSVENGVHVPDHTPEAFVSEYLARVEAHTEDFMWFLNELLSYIAPSHPSALGNKRPRVI